MSSRYSVTDAVTSNDQFLGIKQTNGTYMMFPVSVLVTYLNTVLSISSGLTKQASTPSATGFSVTIESGETWLLLTPTAGFAAGTIVLPTGVDGEEIAVSCTQLVTTLTVNADASVVGAPETLSANSFFKMRYDSTTDAWYRVG